MKENVAGRPMEILLIEDSLTVGTRTMGALRSGSFPHRCTWLTDGERALEFLHQRGIYSLAPRPDLVLLDLGLPKIDGMQVLTEMKASETLRTIPVVIMTASTDPQERQKAEQLAVASYLEKPIDFDEFIALVLRLKRFWKSDVLLPAGTL
ncbi:MAG: response regulator receiver [Planctomycetaceae bacterium]|nr:response regulator receiver [Planctomycetaceae bacterium]